MRARRSIPTPWMTATEAATYARRRGFSEITTDVVRRHAGCGLLTAYTAGKHRIRARVEDVDAWLETCPHIPRQHAEAASDRL